eukprot:3068705-Amphidinium_carterae.1
MTIRLSFLQVSEAHWRAQGYCRTAARTTPGSPLQLFSANRSALPSLHTAARICARAAMHAQMELTARALARGAANSGNTTCNVSCHDTNSMCEDSEDKPTLQHA